MKKLLLSSAALCGLAMVATPAAAQVTLELGGHFKGYGAYVSQEDGTDDMNNFDFIRNTEIHFGGETTLDNGLTVGAHVEAQADGDTPGGDAANDGFDVDESYIYMSGSWGRVNVGDEDGAAYLLQVAAPSADSNIDGVRQFVNPVNYTAAGLTLTNVAVTGRNGGGLDYDHDTTGKFTKASYLSPILNGFQLGASYTPESTDPADENGIGLDADDTIEETYEGALRYEGVFNNVGVIAGLGYSHGEAGTATDDRTAWNAGLDLDFGPFGIGAAYTEDDYGEVGGATEDEDTIVVGVDYTTGPFKIGASYLNKDNVGGISDDEADRYAAGVTYTYGPGMTFRGSVGHVELEDDSASVDEDATYVTVGTQINF